MQSHRANHGHQFVEEINSWIAFFKGKKEFNPEMLNRFSALVECARILTGEKPGKIHGFPPGFKEKAQAFLTHLYELFTSRAVPTSPKDLKHAFQYAASVKAHQFVPQMSQWMEIFQSETPKVTDIMKQQFDSIVSWAVKQASMIAVETPIGLKLGSLKFLTMASDFVKKQEEKMLKDALTAHQVESVLAAAKSEVPTKKLNISDKIAIKRLQRAEMERERKLQSLKEDLNHSAETPKKTSESSVMVLGSPLSPVSQASDDSLSSPSPHALRSPSAFFGRVITPDTDSMRAMRGRFYGRLNVATPKDHKFKV